MTQHHTRELLPPASADCPAVKIDKHRRRELETKTRICPPKRVSSKGLTAEDIAAHKLEEDTAARALMPCLNDPTRLQVRARNLEQLEKQILPMISATDREKVTAFFRSNHMTDHEIRDKCVASRSYLAELFDSWGGTGFVAAGNYSLTSVGIAIAHANIKRVTGEFADLSTWIN